MADTLTSRIENVFDSWATNLAEVRTRAPDYVVLSWHDGHYRYANGKKATPLDSWLSDQDVLCRVDPEKVAWASIEVPVEAVSHLDGIVDNKLGQLSPWDSRVVKYGYDLAGLSEAQSGERKQVVAIAMVNGDEFSFESDKRQGSGKKARSVAYEVISGAGGRITLRSKGESKAFKNLGFIGQLKSFLIALMMITVLGWVAWYVVDYFENQKSSDLLQRQAEARLKLQRIQAAEANNPDFDNVLMKVKRSRPSNRALLESLARILPSHTHAENITLDGNKIRVSGLTDDSAIVLRAVADSGVFDDVRFTAPILREDNGSRLLFELEATIGLEENAVSKLTENLRSGVSNQ